MSLSWSERVAYTRMRWHLAAARFEILLVRRALQERKANFNANQPRVPAGQREGGRWSNGGGTQSRDHTANSGQSGNTRRVDVSSGANGTQTNPAMTGATVDMNRPGIQLVASKNLVTLITRGLLPAFQLSTMPPKH